VRVKEELPPNDCQPKLNNSKPDRTTRRALPANACQGALPGRAQHVAVGGRLELHPRSYPELTIDNRLRRLDASPTVQRSYSATATVFSGTPNEPSRAVKSFGSVWWMEELLVLRDVWLSYPRGRRHVVRVLADVSLEVRAGEVVAVLAQRAQGKTSLLRVAAGMERPDRGSVLFAGEDLWRPAGADRRAARWRAPRARGAPIALVRPGAPDVDVPALDGVALPLIHTHGRRGAYERAERALAGVGAQECARRHWRDLADCERARVAIAQALAREPRLLLVDDLTATLGMGETEALARLLHALAAERGLGVLMSVGDAGATGWSERVATLAGGELLLAPAPPGTPAEGHPNVIGFPGG
jgi:ABC-type cobalamin/Fe3+-siderophores transport system ATPase subunit